MTARQTPHTCYPRGMRTIGVLVALALAAGCSPAERGPAATHLPPDEAARVLLDRNWIDRLPERASDRLHVYRFVPSMGGGVYQDRTVWKGSFELFTFEVRGDELRVATPEDGAARRTRFRVDRIAAGPEGTDLRLVLEDPPRGPTTYYGWSGETDRLGAALDARLAARRVR